MTQTLATSAGVRRLPHGTAFWTTAAVFLTAMAFTTIPTPLYALYQARDGFPTWLTTVIFAVYAVGVALSLYLVGHVSDWVGRRPLALAALAVEILAAVLFLVAPTVPGLLIARFVSGVGVGALTASATAHLGELWRAAKPDAGGVVPGAVATLANIGGLALGPLVGGVLAEFVPDPLVTPYVLSIVVLAIALLVAVFAPETVTRERRPWRPQRVAVPADGRAVFSAAAAGSFSAFAVFGLFTALAPSFLAGQFGVHSRLIAGVVPFAVFASAAITQVFLTRVAVARQLLIAVIAMVAGLAGLAVSALTLTLWLFIVGGIVAGAGVGLLFRASLGVAGGLVEPARRGEVLAGMFLVAYIGLSIPVLAVGVALALVPTVTVLVVFSVVIAVAVLIAGPRMIKRVSA